MALLLFKVKLPHFIKKCVIKQFPSIFFCSVFILISFFDKYLLNTSIEVGRNIIVIRNARTTPIAVNIPMILTGLIELSINEKKPIDVVMLVKKQGKQISFKVIFTALKCE